mmetsp:Transcript_43160/g.99466  ORF Transcript_43160/g.99466 Transcript_43160/m.99466 type:complete len:259 (-) Transcript_43160:399-1175(-)
MPQEETMVGAGTTTVEAKVGSLVVTMLAAAGRRIQAGQRRRTGIPHLGAIPTTNQKVGRTTVVIMAVNQAGEEATTTKEGNGRKPANLAVVAAGIRDGMTNPTASSPTRSMTITHHTRITDSPMPSLTKAMISPPMTNLATTNMRSQHTGNRIGMKRAGMMTDTTTTNMTKVTAITTMVVVDTTSLVLNRRVLDDNTARTIETRGPLPPQLGVAVGRNSRAAAVRQQQLLSQAFKACRLTGGTWNERSERWGASQGPL